MQRRPSRPIAILAACGLGSAVLAAPAAAPAAPSARVAAKTLTLSAPADGSLRFSTKRLSAPHGTIVLRLRNPSDNSHAIALGSKSGSVVSDGGVSRITVRLKKGRYTYYCPVGSHRSLGMRGTLTVR